MESFNSTLKSLVKKKKSWLCVGLDISTEALSTNNLNKLKQHTFKVIDATRDFAIAYKPNFAFFERWGAAGLSWLEETVEYIGPGFIKIADAKRGDIGNTAKQYSESIFYHFGFDCTTINPYMGSDSIKPFLKNPRKGAFVLCRTSNPSAVELQNVMYNKTPLYKMVVEIVNKNNENNNVGLVVGATAQIELKKVRKAAPKLPILIPGIGAQGGDLNSSLTIGNKTGVAILNISRGISFAGDMSEKVINKKAEQYLDKMRNILS